jgi:hypothetical protein
MQLLESLCQQDSQNLKSPGSTTAASLAALALELKKNKVLKEDFTKKWMKWLAPSFQRGKWTRRLRPRIIGESAFSKLGSTEPTKDKLISTETIEAKHKWYVSIGVCCLCHFYETCLKLFSQEWGAKPRKG